MFKTLFVFIVLTNRKNASKLLLYFLKEGHLGNTPSCEVTFGCFRESTQTEYAKIDS